MRTKTYFAIMLVSIAATGIGNAWVLSHEPHGFHIAYGTSWVVDSSYDSDGIMAYAKAWDSGNVTQYTQSNYFGIRSGCFSVEQKEIDVEFNIVHTKQGNNPFAHGCSSLAAVNPYTLLFERCGVQNTTFTLQLRTNTPYILETNAFTVGDGTAAPTEYRSEIRIALPYEPDTTPPSIAIHAPVDTYVLNQTVPADYVCTDCSSGIASCIGSVAEGAPIDTSSVGKHSFDVDATDNAGLTTQASVEYDVVYGVQSLHDKNKCHNAIKVQLVDANGMNVSDKNIELAALNADGEFHFTGDAYTFNLKTKELPSGTHVLKFKASNSDAVYETELCIK